MPPDGPPAPGKRKKPQSDAATSSNNRSAKRVKTSNVRTILAQDSDKALSKNGELDVPAFVKSREFEIKALGASMGASKNFLSKRAFQQVPLSLRRRTASHNAKKVPKRLRARAVKEMKDDNTPTVTSRRRKQTPHQMLRLEKAKELKKLGALSKKKRKASAKQKAKDTDPENAVLIAPRTPKLKKDEFSKPAKPPARFRKRQIHKSWLPTHIYHAKRAHMTPPKEPLWRFAIPLTPTDKSYRTTHRAVSSRGCIAWDMSYMATIGVHGVESSLLGLLRSLGVAETLLTGKREAKWRRGTRWREIWIRERDGLKRWIGIVGITWSLNATAVEDTGTEDQALRDEDAQYRSATPELNDKHDKTFDKQSPKREHKVPRRQLFLRIHPSAFFQTWNEVLKVSKIQRPPAAVEDLRFEVGSIEITGPESTQALIGTLQPTTDSNPTTSHVAEDPSNEGWEDFETPGQIWRRLIGVMNPSSLPCNAVLGFNVSDPRLHHPPRTVQLPDLTTANESLLELISSWPPDHSHNNHDIFDRTKRLTASRQLSSQKAINRRKGDSLPGAYPTPSPRDPKIPLLLMASRTPTTAAQGSWTVLLPRDCVLPVWYSLMHYPLSSGGNPRFGGLQEKRQISFEQGIPWFPADYPGTKAGFEWELLERERKRLEWEKRPKGKRTAWESVNLGNSKKGELGLGWACDWERLFQEPSPPNEDGGYETGARSAAEDAVQTTSAKTKGDQSSRAIADTNSQTRSTHLSHPPLGIHHIVAPHSGLVPYPDTSLSTVHLTLITTGHPTQNARIYRLPTTKSDLRKKWLTLSRPFEPSKKAPPRHIPHIQKNAAPHQQAQRLAASLLTPASPNNDAATDPPKAGDQSYPCVPDECDLIGFVTTGNYHLGEGKCEAIGSIAVARVMGEKDKSISGNERNLCIVRESGQSLGRLARWRFV